MIHVIQHAAFQTRLLPRQQRQQQHTPSLPPSKRCSSLESRLHQFTPLYFIFFGFCPSVWSVCVFAAANANATDEQLPGGRLTGGRHGYGQARQHPVVGFTVETLDPDRALRYRQTWKRNMSEAGVPVIDSIPKVAAQGRERRRLHEIG